MATPREHKEVFFTIRIEQSLKRELEKIAKSEQSTLARICRIALKNYSREARP